MSSKKPKPNQPCHCGSGKKYKKCCWVLDDSTPTERKEKPTNSNGTFNGHPLRFKVGDRVLANVTSKWLPGVVVDTHYSEIGWPRGKFSPYQILLEHNDRLIHAPEDTDMCVKKYDKQHDESFGWNTDKKKKGKAQLRQEAKNDEALEAKRKENEKLCVIPEDGNEETVNDDFERFGMLECCFLFEDDGTHYDCSFEMEYFPKAGWEDLRVPSNTTKSALSCILTKLLGCVRHIRSDDEDLEDDDIDALLDSDMVLPTLIRMCIAPEQFKISDEGLDPSEFVWDCVTLIEKLQCHPGSKFQIDGLLAKLLFAIIRICSSSRSIEATELSCQTIGALFHKASKSAFMAIVEELQYPRPCRGLLCDFGIRAIFGCEPALLTTDEASSHVKSWVEYSHVASFCDAMVKILVDSTSSAETNGRIFGQISYLLRNTDWTERVLSITIDAMRYCEIHMNVDTSWYGGLDTVLKETSQIVAAKTGRQDELFLLKETFIKDSRGINPCYCARHPHALPKIVCNFEKERDAEEAVKSMLDDASEYLKNEQYHKVKEITANAAEKIEIDSPKNNDQRRHTHFLRGQACAGLGDCEDGLYCFAVAIGGDPEIDEKIRYGASKLQVDSCLAGIRLLISLGRFDAANIWLSFLLRIDACKSSKLGGVLNSEYLANAQAEANELVTNRSKNLADAPAAILIDSNPAKEEIPCHVRQCTWKSVGRVEREDGGVSGATIAVPRLNIAIIWVRERLLIWNYKESKVIQWIEKPAFETCHQEIFHTSDNTSIFVFYTQDGTPNIILLDELHRLKEGGTSIAADAMYETIGYHDKEAWRQIQSPLFLRESNQQFSNAFRMQRPLDWFLHLSKLKNNYGKVGPFAGAQINRTKGWNLAFIADAAGLGIVIFSGDDTIAPGVALGPFAFLRGEPSFILKGKDSHTQFIHELAFVNDGFANTLVSSSGDKSIKLWDISSRSCHMTIRGFNNSVHTFACTTKFIFAASSRHYRGGTSSLSDMKEEERENETFGSHCVNVWDVVSGKHLATLRSKSGKSVKDIAVIPGRNIILSGHSSGDVHVWKYEPITKKFWHIQGFGALLRHSAEAFWGQIFHLHRDYVVVMSTIHLTILDDPVITEVNESKSSCLPLVGDYKNCGFCGLWKIGSSFLCSGCGSVSYCDSKCQRKAWSKHKKECQKGKKRFSQ